MDGVVQNGRKFTCNACRGRDGLLYPPMARWEMAEHVRTQRHQKRVVWAETHSLDKVPGGEPEQPEVSVLGFVVAQTYPYDFRPVSPGLPTFQASQQTSMGRSPLLSHVFPVPHQYYYRRATGPTTQRLPHTVFLRTKHTIILRTQSMRRTLVTATNFPSSAYSDFHVSAIVSF